MVNAAMLQSCNLRAMGPAGPAAAKRPSNRHGRRPRAHDRAGRSSFRMAPLSGGRTDPDARVMVAISQALRAPGQKAGEQMNTDWSPTQYEKFAAERAKAFDDLVSLIERRSDMRVVDLGCGTGELTDRLATALDAVQVLGIDSSETMLERARVRARGGLHFEQGDIATWIPEQTWDLVFSNAALHWIPDHPALFGRLAAAVADRGQLAVQVPANFEHPSHAVAEELAAEPPYVNALHGQTRGGAVLDLRHYATLLHDLGFARQHVRAQVYLHELPDRDAIVQWTRGSTLTWYEQRLPPALFDTFVDTYKERLFTQLEDVRPYPYPFQRYLLWATR